jgi:hypothetical protein
MERRYYSVRTLTAELAAFERQFQMSSAAFLDEYEQDRLPEDMSRFDAFSWATTYRELLRLGGSVRAPQPLR